jgi:chorismate synthase
MSGNTIGTIFRVTTFGESHGMALGVVIDGCPAGITFDEELLYTDLLRRKPGQSSLTTQRNEDEAVELLSGVFEGKTTGMPIAMLVRNKDQRTKDYDQIKNVYRPSHADYVYDQKYGIRDHRGSGRASARETVARVMAGAVAKMLLKAHSIHISAYVSSVADIVLDAHYSTLDLSQIDLNEVRCPHTATADKMRNRIAQAKQDGDSVGGTITAIVQNCPPGLGEPVFDKLHAELAKAIMSINACKGFEIGSGFEGTTQPGSMQNDEWQHVDGKLSTKTNNSGGIQGGISNGMDIFFRCAFKPVSTISKQQHTVNTQMEEVAVQVTGRHDPCVLPRAVPIVEAMTAIVLADFLLRNKSSQM